MPTWSFLSYLHVNLILYSSNLKFKLSLEIINNFDESSSLKSPCIMINFNVYLIYTVMYNIKIINAAYYFTWNSEIAQG